MSRVPFAVSAKQLSGRRFFETPDLLASSSLGPTSSPPQ
jgi:hypothetical protein